MKITVSKYHFRLIILFLASIIDPISTYFIAPIFIVLLRRHIYRHEIYMALGFVILGFFYAIFMFDLILRILLFTYNMILITMMRKNYISKRFLFISLLILTGYFFDQLSFFDSTISAELPSLSFLLLNLFHVNIFFFGIIAFLLFFLEKRRMIIAFMVLMKIFKKKKFFLKGAILASLFPLLGLILGGSILAETSLKARFRSSMFILDWSFENLSNLLYGAGIYENKDSFFWPGDVSILGSIYEMGLINTLLICSMSTLLVLKNRRKINTTQLFLFGFTIFNFFGKAAFSFIYFL